MFPIEPILAAINGAARSPVGKDARTANDAARVDVLVFSFHGMRFALPAARVVEVMPVTHERWDRLAKMAGTGTLGTSGLPLIRLAARLGFTDLKRPEQGSLILFGSEGKVRATVLIDDVPVAMRAEVETMPVAWREQFEPSVDMIDGVALLSDGEQALMLDMPMGVGNARPRAASRLERDSAHLLVRAGRTELEAVRVAALRGMSAIDDIGASSPRRMLLLLGG
ncbi:MAG TPA: chemotaxis protein CheW, partial [Ancylobacter sp.]